MNALSLIRQAEDVCRDVFSVWEEKTYYNQTKVLQAFQKYHVRDNYFASSTGYGYGDMGRDELENIYADIFGAEDALVRAQIVSGTHAISACLFALLSPGDEMVAVLGSPYDTLGRVIGSNRADKGTLTDKGIIYKEIPLSDQGKPDYQKIGESIGSNTKLALIQRSRGYSLRSALTIDDIAELVKIIRQANSDTIIFVDNCYGEFTDTKEPTEIGIDLMAGSLIKNPGGGLAPSGGYIAGGKDLVEEVAFHLTAPGLGKALGASLVNKRLLYQGLFMAPHTVLQAVKGAILLAYVCEQQGYEVLPRWSDERGDIVQAVKMNSAAQVIKFCQIVQGSSPVDSDVRLEYGQVPGYTDRIVMAAGTFIQGSSIELSCDAPLREPYVAYLQGGLTYEHCRFVVKELLDNLIA